MIRATWNKYMEPKVMRAMVVECPDCGREDSINSEDKEWDCPDCKRKWVVSELRRILR